MGVLACLGRTYLPTLSMSTHASALELPTYSLPLLPGCPTYCEKKSNAARRGLRGLVGEGELPPFSGAPSLGHPAGAEITGSGVGRISRNWRPMAAFTAESGAVSVHDFGARCL